MTSIFLIDQANGLTELKRAEYSSEDLFQELLAKHPALLGIANDNKGLLLIQREFGVPDQMEAGTRWSLDHLFLDGAGVPVLVEVKRASDTRSRREVVAQMLDYAANGVAYWPTEKLISAFRATCQLAGKDPNEELEQFIETEDPEGFWRQVEANLRSGRVRMIFVADRIPKELRRIVEFLNEQMRPAEVIAIEFEQFLGDGGVRTLVPRVVGRTERAESVKAVSGEAADISEDEWFNGLLAKKGDGVAAAARELLAWFRSEGFQGAVTASGDAIAVGFPRADGRSSWPFFIRQGTGRLDVALTHLKPFKAYASDENRLALLERIRSLPCKTVIVTMKPGSWPMVPLEELGNPEAKQALRTLLLDIKRSCGRTT